ncbi:MAG: hypothetical protein GEV08_25130, partial [Acidimicrobiia bacterium]|nr:hypothetical protein [Acidimicrobiia bacterium]
MLTATEVLPEVRRQAVARLGAARGRLLVVGVGGSGKTELAEAVAADLAERGLVVERLEGRAAPARTRETARGGLGPQRIDVESTEASGPSLVEALAARLGAPAGPDPARRLLGALAERRSALLVDDAHLLDAASADALAVLWSLAPERRVPLLVTRRPGPRPEGLADLDEASAEHERLWLGPLDAEAVALRVAARGGPDLGEEEAAALAEFTAGSARLVDRLAIGGRWPSEGGLPAAVVDEVVGAVDALGPAVARAARVLAAAGPEGPALELALVKTLEGGSTLGDVLARAGLATGAPPAVSLVPVVAAALRAVTPAALLRPVLEQVLRGLDAEAGPELVARLHRLAGHDGEQARAAYRRAAEAALPTRPGDAATWAKTAAARPHGDEGEGGEGAGSRFGDLGELSWIEARAALALGDVDGALRAAEAAGTPSAAPLVAALLPRLGRWADAAARYEALGPEAAPLTDLARLRALGSTSTLSGGGGDGCVVARRRRPTAAPKMKPPMWAATATPVLG